MIRAKFEIAGTAPEGLVDRDWIRRNVLELTDQEIESIEKGKIEDTFSSFTKPLSNKITNKIESIL